MLGKKTAQIEILKDAIEIAHEKLRKDCPELETVRIRQLSERDSLLMAEKLLNPPEPNEKLKALFAEDSKKQVQK